MENTKPQKIKFDPWQNPTRKYKKIILVLLPLITVFAIYDGVTFYSYFKEICNKSSNRIECKGFEQPIIQTKPKLDVVIDQGSGNFAIQIGAFRRINNANNLISRFHYYDVQPRIIKANDKKRRIWNKVQIGRFKDKKTALNSAQELKSKGFFEDFIITKYRSE